MFNYLEVAAFSRKEDELNVGTDTRNIQYNVFITAKEAGVSLPIIEAGAEGNPLNVPILSPTVVNLQQITTSLTLYRGKQYTIYSGKLPVLAAASCIYDGRFYSSRYLTFTEIEKPTDNTRHRVMLCLNVELPTYLNVRGKDLATLQCETHAGAFNFDLVDSAQTRIRVKAMQEIGIGFGIPQIFIKSIGDDHSSNNFDLGKQVMRACLLNFDKNDHLQSSRIFNQFNIDSDKLKETLDWDNLINYRYRKFENSFESDLRAQSMVLFDRERPLNQVGIHFDFEVANLTQAQNYVVAHRLVCHTGTQTWATQKYGDHRAADMRQLNEFNN